MVNDGDIMSSVLFAFAMLFFRIICSCYLYAICILRLRNEEFIRQYIDHENEVQITEV